MSWAPGLGLGWEHEILRSLDVAIVFVVQPATPDKLDSQNCKVIGPDRSSRQAFAFLFLQRDLGKWSGVWV